MYQSAPPQSPTGSHRPPFSSPASAPLSVTVTVPYSVPAPDFNTSLNASFTTSAVDRGSASAAGVGLEIPIEFVWKSVSGILVLGLSPYPNPDLGFTPNPVPTPQDVPADFPTQNSPVKFAINLAGENNDKGRITVTTILQSLAKSVYDMYKSDKKRKLLILQKETIRKLRYVF